MRKQSHLRLGEFLVERYMPDVKERHACAFLIGCIEPDKNPFTYLKGSFRHQWLRGHNYCNARRYMRKICSRLEKKRSLGLLDYYSLGKLVHYTADAFTLAHNNWFPDDLHCHRTYESAHQHYFLNFINSQPCIDFKEFHSIMESITTYHRQYSSTANDIHRDCHYILTVCCGIFIILSTKNLI